jgi:hypothetical protein
MLSISQAIFCCLALAAAEKPQVASGNSQPLALSAHAAAIGAFSCGPKAAWVFARLCGAPINRNLLDSFRRDHPRGTTFHQIQQFLQSNGVRCQIRRMNPSELLPLSEPVIAFVSPDYAGGLGHFVIVTEVSNRGVRVIDPAAATHYLWGWKSFSDAWSGHVLLRDRSKDESIMTIGLLAHAALLACVCLIGVRSNALVSIRRKTPLIKL